MKNPLLQRAKRSVSLSVGGRRTGRHAVSCQAAADFAKFGNKAYLDKAAARFRTGLEHGLKEDELVAIELGVSSFEELSEVQLQYVDKVKQKLVQRAEELRREEAERRALEAANLEAGKRAYEYGEYAASVRLLEAAVDESGRMSVLGGEAMMWLALAYQACGREAECIETYKWLEDNHPIKKVRKQAADLRYIMEAPKLEVSPDERVQIPLLQSETWRQDRRKTTATPRYGAGRSKVPASSSYWDKATWDVDVPFVPDKWYYRVAWALLALGLTLYLNWQYVGGSSGGSG